MPQRLMSTSLRVFAIFAGSIMLASCGLSSPTTPTVTPAISLSGASAQILPTESASELIRINGLGAPYTSPPLQFSSDVTLLVHWEQSSVGEFSFVMSSGNGFAETVVSDEILFELVLGPSTGSGEAAFSPGDYVLKVTAADGPWLIWIETIEI
jgi:hypothetical protein